MLVRVLFVASCLMLGPQVLLYVALWIIMPSGPAPPSARGVAQAARAGSCRSTCTIAPAERRAGRPFV